jgi:nucleolar protein 56
VMQAVDSLDELNKVMNTLAERLRAWYSPHWPELEKVALECNYAVVIAAFRSREGVIGALEGGAALPEGCGLDPGQLLAQARMSRGCGMDGRSLDAVVELARAHMELSSRCKAMESYVKEAMEDAAPCLNALTGPLVGARLIRLAGGMRRLAVLPSSTIQILGAEKALFSHLREGTKPPKHGIIFQHPLIHTAGWWQRGRIARHFAGKISIAVRSDHFGGSVDGAALLEGVSARAEEVKRSLPQPPPGRMAPQAPRRFGPRMTGWRGATGQNRNRRPTRRGGGDGGRRGTGMRRGGGTGRDGGRWGRRGP